MKTTVLSQPERQLGALLFELASSSNECKKIVLASAFVGLRTILRLRESLLAQRDSGSVVALNIGFDLLGTSKNVLEELLQWNCDIFLTHNALPRVNYHPKVYLFEAERKATLIVGSNNLTEGGMDTNYEAASVTTFELPAERAEYMACVSAIRHILEPSESGTTKELTKELIGTLADAGLIVNEAEARKRSEKAKKESPKTIQDPFAAKSVPFPPLIKAELRTQEVNSRTLPEVPESQISSGSFPSGMLAWRKVLPASDVLVVSANTNPIGGVKLTQADFEIDGVGINQTQYFRQLFNDYPWEQNGRYPNQERTFVPMRVRINGTDHGIVRFEISHKPSGEAGQGNYTSKLHWGRNFAPVIRAENLTGKTLYLYETPDAEVDFYMDIE